MRPDDLLDAMSKISQEYIAEAKPFSDDAAESQTEKRFSAEGTASQEIVMHGRKSAGSRNGKGSFMKKHSLIQRMTAGAAAVAACAVCVGGGWYVLNQLEQQQAEENSSEIVSEIEETSETEPEIAATNFLGGQGEIRVLNNPACKPGNMILCDDTRWYFMNGRRYAERSDAEVSEYYPVSAEAGAIAENLLHDGSRFYVADGLQIYQLEQDGSRSETPFFTMDTALLPNNLSAENLRFNSILKLDENTFIITVQRENSTNNLPIYETMMNYSKPCSYIYYADSGKTDPIEEELGFRFLPGGDGSFYAIHTEMNEDGFYQTDDSIVRVWPDGSHEQETYAGFDGPMNRVADWVLKDDTLYVVLQYQKGEYGFQTDWGALDLQTKDIRILQSDDERVEKKLAAIFNAGGELFAIQQQYSYEGTDADASYTLADVSCTLYRADADLNLLDPLFEVKPDAQYPEEVSVRLKQCYGLEAIESVAADDRYFMMTIAGHQFALLDRETGNVQYFIGKTTPEESVTETSELHVDESRYTVLDPGFTGQNFLGGNGSLHIPKDGRLGYWFDDDNYYYNNDYFSRSGNEEKQLVPTQVAEPINAMEQYVAGRIMSDGERLYVQQNGAINLIDSSGELTPIFNLEDVGLNRNRKVSNVYHIGDAYCFCGSESVKNDPNPEHWEFYSFYVWTDRNGKYLGGQTNLPYIGAFLGSYSGDTCTSVFYFSYENGTKLRLTPPDSGDTSAAEMPLPDFTLDSGQKWIADDKIYYLDEDGNFCCYNALTAEKNVLLDHNTMEQQGINLEYSGALNDGKVYYSTQMKSGAQKFYCINRFDPETGETERVLTVDSAAAVTNLVGLNFTIGKLNLFMVDGEVVFDPQTMEFFRLYEAN